MAIEHGTYALKQDRLVEGLPQQQEVCSENIFCLQNWLSVTRHEQDPYIGPQLSHFFCDSWTLHFRHDHVCEHKMDRPIMARREFYRLSTARGSENRVTAATEHSSRDFTERLLVVDDQDRLSSEWELVVHASIGRVTHGLIF